MKKILLTLSVFSQLALALPNAEQAFQQADAVNQLDDNVTFNVDVHTKKRDYAFAVFINQRQNSIVKYLKPNKDRGKKILAKGMNMWIFIPSGKKPIRISPQQRLVGSVSNIDVARISLGIDYRATDIVEAEYHGAPAWQLTLTSKNPQSLYERVTLLINPSNFFPQQATFYTKSAIASKTMTFANYQPVDGKILSTQRIIVDLLTGSRAELTYSHFKPSTITDEYFQPNAFAFF